MRSTTSRTSGTWLPDRIDSPITSTPSSFAVLTISAGVKRMPPLDHVHADIAGADRDLLGAVGMAVEARLADQEFHAAAELVRQALDFGTDRLKRLRRPTWQRGFRHAGRCAIFAEHFAEDGTPIRRW